MVFAAAFLINDDVASSLTSADDIAVQFGVSLDAARIYFEQMLEEKERPAAAERVQRIAADFRALVAEKTSTKPVIAFPRNAHCGGASACPLSEPKRKTCARREYFAF